MRRPLLAVTVEQRRLRGSASCGPAAIYANVEYYAALILDAVGLPRELFTPTFAVSRVVGWTAHIIKQSRHNKIIRPSAHYTGPLPARR